MARRKVDVPRRISIMIPDDLLIQVDQWKVEIDDISRSELISKLVRYALQQDAIDHLYPDQSSSRIPSTRNRKTVVKEPPKNRTINNNFRTTKYQTSNEHPTEPFEMNIRTSGNSSSHEPEYEDISSLNGSSRSAEPEKMLVNVLAGPGQGSQIQDKDPKVGPDRDKHGGWGHPNGNTRSLSVPPKLPVKPVLNPDEFEMRMKELQKRVERI